MTEIKIEHLPQNADTLPLYTCGIQGPQSAYLYLTETGHVYVAPGGSDTVSGVPMDIWHGRRLRWPLSPYLTREQVIELLDDPQVHELLERVHAGHRVEWDGSNHVGRLSEDALDAAEELRQYLEANYLPDTPVWAVDDWLRADGRNRHLSSVWPPDVPLEEAVQHLTAEADADGIVLIGSIRDALLDWLCETAAQGDELTGEHARIYQQSAPAPRLAACDGQPTEE